MKLILISTPNYFVEEDQIITSLFDEGLDCLHMRKPETEPVYAERFLTLLPEKYRKKIVVHDNFYLKNEFDLKGIHLNSRNPMIPGEYNGQVSASCHTLDDVSAQKKLYEYVFLSPIFDSISKKGYRSAFSEELLRKAAKMGVIDKKVVALGGIDETNIQLAKEIGFGGVAVMGGLWNHFDPVTDYNYQKLIQQFVRLKKLAE